MIGISLTYYYNNPIFDAWASILIGILLTTVAIFMAVETKHLLIGESASQNDIKQIEAILRQFNSLESFGNIKTMHLGPDEILLGANVNFKDDLSVKQIEPIVEKIKADIQKANPKIKYIYIESDNIK
jgi:divalent metal cation (Fe/Co/Zn/Cd) transporter